MIQNQQVLLIQCLKGVFIKIDEKNLQINTNNTLFIEKFNQWINKNYGRMICE